MKGLSRTVKIVLIVTSLILSMPVISNGIPSGIEISSKYTAIQVGEPLIFKLVYRYEEPLIKPATGKIKESLLHHAYLKIEHHEGKFLTDGFPIFPMDLTLQDKQGLEYSGQFVFLHHPGEKRLLFPVTGTYTVTVSGSTKVSNPLKIAVEPTSVLENRALSLLSDRNDYFFLEYGEHEYENRRAERISHLKEVVEQCEGTLLAKWAAARLGIEEYEELETKHSLGERFTAKYRAGLIKEPLVENAHAHLVKALELPDEFPIRQEVLYHLIGIEIFKGNNDNAISYASELNEKYPKGEFGKKTSVAKLQDEIVRLQGRLEKLSQIERDKIEDLIKWLEEFWLTNENIKEAIDPNQWQELIETIKKQTEN